MNKTENKVTLHVEGMDCANCAQTITRVLQKEGNKDVNVNFATGEVVFEEVLPEKLEQAVKSINSLGYKVVAESKHEGGQPHAHQHESLRGNAEGD